MKKSLPIISIATLGCYMLYAGRVPEGSLEKMFEKGEISEEKVESTLFKGRMSVNERHEREVDESLGKPSTHEESTETTEKPLSLQGVTAVRFSTDTEEEPEQSERFKASHTAFHGGTLQTAQPISQQLSLFQRLNKYIRYLTGGGRKAGEVETKGTKNENIQNKDYTRGFKIEVAADTVFNPQLFDCDEEALIQLNADEQALLARYNEVVSNYKQEFNVVKALRYIINAYNEVMIELTAKEINTFKSLPLCLKNQLKKHTQNYPE